MNYDILTCKHTKIYNVKVKVHEADDIFKDKEYATCPKCHTYGHSLATFVHQQLGFEKTVEIAFLVCLKCGHNYGVREVADSVVPLDEISEEIHELLMPPFSMITRKK